MKCPAGHESQATDYCDTCGAAMDAVSSQGDAVVEAGVGDAPAPTDEAAAGTSGTGESDGSVSEADLCPNCSAAHVPDALFCEACGYDYTTGAMPRAQNSLDLDAPAQSSTPESGSPESASTPGVTSTADPGAAAPSAAGPSAGSTQPPMPSSAPPLDPPWVAEVWIDPQWYAEQESPDPLPSAGLPSVVPLRHTSLLIGRVSHSRHIQPDIDCGADNGVSRRHAQLTTDGTRWWIEDLDSSNGTFLADGVGEVPTRPIPTGRKSEVPADARIFLGSWTRIVLRPAAEGEV